jgi:hypothetical protein
MMKAFPAIKEREEMRKIIGRYGLTGRQQVCETRNENKTMSFNKSYVLGLPDSSAFGWSTVSCCFRLSGRSNSSLAAHGRTY